MAKNGVKHLKTVPYHSVTNGLAEHAVQMLKTAMKKSASEGNIDTRLARFLFHYRTTPNSTTVVFPAELLMGRKLKTPGQALSKSGFLCVWSTTVPGDESRVSEPSIPMIQYSSSITIVVQLGYLEKF